ncbi:MAG: hypothetical protein MJ099_06920, partial [Clostridia bacterium]|nr:hypothetical protein [Clostridia bacterium]
IKTFVGKPHLLTAILFMLLFRFPEAQLAKMAQPFMLRGVSEGGLVVATSELNVRTADTLMRLRRTGINVRLYLAADSGEEETGKLIQRMKMAGIEVMRAEPDIA